MNKLPLMILGLVAVACASNEAQIREAIRKDPSIVFDAIEEHPEQFMAVVNRSAKLAQQKKYESQVAEMKQQEDQDLKNPKNPKLDPVRRMSGDDSGKIVIVEYADFQCPACGMAYGPLKEFKEKHKRQVQFYYKNLPLDFHPLAAPAAHYFEALRLQDKAKAQQFYDFVYENQKSLSEDFLKQTAKKFGADMKRLEKDRHSDAVEKVLADDRNEFQSFHFNGTPAIIINGVSMYGAQSLEDLERVSQLTLKH